MTGDYHNGFCNGNSNDNGDDDDGVVNSEFFYIYVVIFSVLISGPGLSRWYNSILSTYLQYCSWLVQRQVRFWQLEILIF